ncbi:protein YcgK [Escherichia coli]|uniref:Protein YcgK n=1 Tax=Escherichia coli TaxID=562 RepID=A0A377DF80_ECOLX|nr:protein YcgK [Escherichia coli]
MKALILTSSGQESMIQLIYPDIPQNSIVHGQYSLPASGKYELRVLQTRNDARKNKTKKYNVDIQIK